LHAPITAFATPDFMGLLQNSHPLNRVISTNHKQKPFSNSNLALIALKVFSEAFFGNVALGIDAGIAYV